MVALIKYLLISMKGLCVNFFLKIYTNNTFKIFLFLEILAYSYKLYLENYFLTIVFVNAGPGLI